MIGLKCIASVSFGKDSLAMLLKLIEKDYPVDEVLFFDTGAEFNSIYHNRDRIKPLLEKQGIRFTELHSPEPFWYKMFVRPVKYRKSKNMPYPFHYGKGWCGGTVRWGTESKVVSIRNHYKEMYGDEEIFEYIGVAADEPDRIEKNIHKVYPLYEWGMTEKDCLEYCYEQGYDWDEDGVELYSVLDRVSCWCCRNKNLKELKAIYQYLPDYWQKLRGIQSRIDEPMKGPGKSVFDLEERFRKELEEENNHT